MNHHLNLDDRWNWLISPPPPKNKNNYDVWTLHYIMGKLHGFLLNGINLGRKWINLGIGQFEEQGQSRKWNQLGESTMQHY
jgi:hypothetical protein